MSAFQQDKIARISSPHGGSSGIPASPPLDQTESRLFKKILSLAGDNGIRLQAAQDFQNVSLSESLKILSGMRLTHFSQAPDGKRLVAEFYRNVGAKLLKLHGVGIGESLHIIGEGASSVVVGNGEKAAAIRKSPDDHSYAALLRQRWVTGLLGSHLEREPGMSVARIEAIGRYPVYHAIIQEKDGINGWDYIHRSPPGESERRKAEVFKALGIAVRHLGSLSVPGFGSTQRWDDLDWRGEHPDREKYNQSLLNGIGWTPAQQTRAISVLAAAGVLCKAEIFGIRELAREAAEKGWHKGLIHGDLGPHNILINREDPAKSTPIDWDWLEVGHVPLVPLAGMLSGNPDSSSIEIRSFTEGLSPDTDPPFSDALALGAWRAVSGAYFKLRSGASKDAALPMLRQAKALAERI